MGLRPKTAKFIRIGAHFNPVIRGDGAAPSRFRARVSLRASISIPLSGVMGLRPTISKNTFENSSEISIPLSGVMGLRQSAFPC